MYEGEFRVVDPDREVLAQFDPSRYLDYIGEHVEPWSYLKFPYFKPQGYPQGCYRVGPLGRLNVAENLSTRRADEALIAYRATARGGLEGATLMYHYARMIELLNCLERAEGLLKHKEICGNDIRITAPPSREEGVGVIEAPRGTLIHHYKVDRHGTIRKVNLIVATGHNNIAMNRSVELVAKEYIHGGQLREGLLNRVEGAIRSYDPCLSCSTHALGQMPLRIQICGHDGMLLRELRRD